MDEERVIKISHLRDSLGWAYREVAQTDIPIIVQRYSRQDVAIVPLWEWQFFKELDAGIKAGRCPVGREMGGKMPMFTQQVNIDALCAQAEALCRRVAPLDLGDSPLYIVPQSRLPDELGGKSVCDGFTAPNLDIYLQDEIGPAWRGRGGCMVVNEDQVGSDSDYLETDIFRIVLHEFAHILERPMARCVAKTADPMRLKFEALCLGDAVSREPSPEIVTAPFQGHGPRFIRAALHLRHRAEAAGVLVPLYGYCAGNRYGLSHPNRYREALGDEPDHLADHSIREILDIPYPKVFWRLWTTDLAHWHSVCSQFFQRSDVTCVPV